MPLSFQRWTPPDASPAEVQRVRVTVPMGFLAIAITVVLLVVYAVVGWWWLWTASFIGFGSIFIALTLLPRVGTAVAGHLIMVGAWICITLALATSGGILARFLPWLVLIPLMGGALTGLRGGIGWTITTTLTLVGFLGIHLTGIPLPESVPHDLVRLFDIVLQTSLMLIGVAGTALVYVLHQEWAEDRANAAISRLEAEVDARRAAEAELRATLDARSRFLATVSHDLRTPIAGIMGVTDLLAADALPHTSTQLVRSIQGSGSLLLRLLNDLLDASKLEEGQLELEDGTFSPVDTIEEVVDLLGSRAREKGLRLVMHLDPGLPREVRGDRVRVQQMLMNYLANAIKFTARGHVRLHARYDANAFHVEVSDTGPGIPAERQPRLFEPYVQASSSTAREYGGTGLGLFIVRALAEKMGGTVGLESTTGEGSTFRFTLPCPACTPAPTPPRTGPVVWILDPLQVAGEASAAAVRAVGGHPRVYTHIDAFRTAWRGRMDLGGTPDWLFVDHVLVRRSAADVLSWLQLVGGSRSVRICVVVTSGIGAELHLPDRIDARLDYPLRRSALTRLWSLQPPAPPPESVQTSPGGRALVVDDNAVNRLVLARMMEREGYTVVAASDGREAVELLLADPCFDLVLMDVHMPVLDGLSATRELRDAHDRTLPIIGVTASNRAEDHAVCIEAGMDASLEKPVEPAALRELIERLHAGPEGDGPDG